MGSGMVLFERALVNEYTIPYHFAKLDCPIAARCDLLNQTSVSRWLAAGRHGQTRLTTSQTPSTQLKAGNFQPM